MNRPATRVAATVGLGLLAFIALGVASAREAAAQVCENTCAHAGDGECDDGGPGAIYALCGYGTDCGDCGSRPMIDPLAVAYDRWAGGCDDSCATARDNECDDGGPASLYSVCRYGSDCSDCGARAPIDPAMVGMGPSPIGCDDTCSSAGDGECDDGGPYSMYALCGLGTDCGDCGPRGPTDGGVVVAPPGPIAVAPPVYAVEEICLDSCATAFDSECDDGGPGSLYNVCDYGTDCGDCGPRVLGAVPVAPEPSGFGPSLCTNTCQYAGDGECDDGGPASLYDLCDYGSDCTDCGPRDAGLAPPPLVIPPYAAGQVCGNTCQWAGDGECDDGGPGSLYDVCEYGSDCTDCGPRDGGMAPVPPAMPQVAGQLCTNTCQYAGDNECDDGGPGSLYDVCEYGSDCTDCGPRDAALAPPPLAAPPHAAGQLCTNTCQYAGDNECDDGGPASLYDLCDYGSDCSDCGPRDPGGAPLPPALPPHASGTVCTNTCQYAGDGECDDGGAGSLYDVCTFGTDCTDCGPRDPSAAAMPSAPPPPSIEPPPIPTTPTQSPRSIPAPTAVPGTAVCTNTCPLASDGECDDGGPGAHSDICSYGTDCTDCGPRPPENSDFL